MTDNASLAALKPCPFCGHPPVLRPIKNDGRWFADCNTVTCIRPTTGLRRNKSEAIAAWNPRATEAEAEIVALRDAGGKGCAQRQAAPCGADNRGARDMSKELAEQLEALAAKATPGPWEADTTENEGEYGSGPDTHSGFKSPVMLDPSGKVLFDAINGDLIEVNEEYDENGCYAWDEPGRCNFALIAALRNNLPAIIDALRAEAEATELREEIARLLEKVEQELAMTALANAEATSDWIDGFEFAWKRVRAALGESQP